ncbi:MAG: diacylglycerol kinase family protein [Fibrobacteria bacterium]
MKTLCLYNPRAGRSGRQALERAFSSRGEAGKRHWGEVTFQSLAEPGRRDWPARLQDFQRIAVFGGDGTVHHVIQHLAFREQELSVFPAGTANDLTCAIGLSLDLERNLALYEDGKTVAYDTIAVNGRHVITGGGFGLGFQAAASANALRNGVFGALFRKFLRAKIYLITLAWHGLLSPPRRVGYGLFLDGKEARGDTQSILFCNQALMGKRVLIAPGTSATDGHFHFVRFRDRHAASILRTLGRVKAGSPKAEVMLDRAEAGELRLEFSEPVPAYGDGEEFAPQTRWDLVCHRGSIRLRVPAAFGGAGA